MDEKNAQSYWRVNIRLILILVAIWAFVSLVLGIILAPILNSISLGYLPLGFWFAQQGSMFVFVILIFVYSFLMDKIDADHNLQE